MGIFIKYLLTRKGGSLSVYPTLTYCHSKLAHIMHYRSHVKMICATMDSNCTARKLCDRSSQVEYVKAGRSSPEVFSPQQLLQEKVKASRDISTSKALPLPGVPSDMNSRVLQLLPLETISPLYCDSSSMFLGPLATNETGQKDALYALERLVFRVLQSYNTKELPRMQNLKFSTEKKVKKDMEPADDPNQKIRRLEIKLRNQLPMFFNKGRTWHDFGDYTLNVELLITPRRYGSKHTLRGLPVYKRVAKAFRLMCKFCLREPRLEILSLTCHEDKKIIEVRWRVTGSPFYLRAFSYLLPIFRQKLIKYYDYMSTLYVTEEAKVWRHEISKLRPSPSPLLKELAGIRGNFAPATGITPLVRKDAT